MVLGLWGVVALNVRPVVRTAEQNDFECFSLEHTFLASDATSLIVLDWGGLEVAPQPSYPQPANS